MCLARESAQVHLLAYTMCEFFERDPEAQLLEGLGVSRKLAYGVSLDASKGGYLLLFAGAYESVTRLVTSPTIMKSLH